MGDLMNLTSVGIGKFIKLIKEAIDEGDVTPFLCLGLSGIGKTECIAGFCKEMGIGYKEVRLINHTETDLIGLPSTEDNVNGGEGESSKITVYAQNSILPVARIDGEVGILVLDEITSCAQNIRTVAYQLLDSSRGVGQYKLPPKWLVIALGNGIEDGGNYQGMESALLSRCRSLRLVNSFENWKKWAVNNGVNATVIAYLETNPSDLHQLDTNIEAGQFPCPRSWTLLSKKLNARETAGMLDMEDVATYAALNIGDTKSAAFAAFYAFNKELLSIEDILSGNEVKNNKKGKRVNSEAMYITVNSVIYALKKEEDEYKRDKNTEDKLKFDLKVANVIHWMRYIVNGGYEIAGNNNKEFVIIMVQSLIVVKSTESIFVNGFDDDVLKIASATDKKKLMSAHEEFGKIANECGVLS